MQDGSGNRSRCLPLSQQLRTSWSKWIREYIPSNNRLWRRYFTRHRWRWWRHSPRYRIRRELTSQKHTSRKWSPCLGPRLRNCLWYRSPWHRLSGHQLSLMKGVRYSRTTGNTLVGLSLMKKVLIPFPLFLFILFYFTAYMRISDPNPYHGRQIPLQRFDTRTETWRCSPISRSERQGSFPIFHQKDAHLVAWGTNDGSGVDGAPFLQWLRDDLWSVSVLQSS